MNKKPKGIGTQHPSLNPCTSKNKKECQSSKV